MTEDDYRKRLDILERRIQTLANETTDIRQKIAANTERAANAERIAQNSVHELETISDAMVRHIRASDDARVADSARTEKGHTDAAAAHAARFDAQGKAIAAQGDRILAMQAAMAKRGQASTLLWALGVFLIPALVPLAQTLYPQGLLPTQSAPVVTVGTRPAPSPDGGTK